jgi:hypothetical protein
MARKKEYRIDIQNPQTREKMNYIASQYPDKTQQQIFDMAVDCLFKAEAENIQKNLARLMGNNAD